MMIMEALVDLVARQHDKTSLGELLATKAAFLWCASRSERTSLASLNHCSVVRIRWIVRLFGGSVV